MGYYCTVPQCTSLAGKTKNVKFHRFPRDVTMADKWNVILKRGKPYTKYSKVCSLHFTQADYNVTTMGQWKTLSKDAVPSQNLPKLNPDGTVMVIRKSRTVKYREGKKDDSDKTDKWQMPMAHHVPAGAAEAAGGAHDSHDSGVVAYRLHTLGHMAATLSPLQGHAPAPRPKKQDAFMQTDPVQNEDDDTQPNNSYSEVSDKSYTSEIDQYQYREDYPMKDPDSYQKDPFSKDNGYHKEQFSKEGSFDSKKYEPKDYTKTSEDYIPQTNEEYNKEAEKYALERKSHNGYEVKDMYHKQILDNYPKIPEVYTQTYEKPYRDGYLYNGYPDSAELLRNQQHNLQMLQERQEQQRLSDNQNFFNENHIKQEIDITDDDKYLYERTKEQLDASQYNERRMQQQRMLDHIQQEVKQEPDTSNGCDNVMQPQSSPYYAATAHNNPPGGYYEGASRPGAELLIAKQNALAAHTQLWQNTMKRPFFYSDNPHYSGPQLLHRYEDISRILQ